MNIQKTGVLKPLFFVVTIKRRTLYKWTVGAVGSCVLKRANACCKYLYICVFAFLGFVVLNG